MPSIAIVGTQGCGKTVFITALAQSLSVMDKRGVFLNPKDGSAIAYVEENWHILQNCDWPPSTRPGEMFDLQWTFKAGQGADYDLRLIDAAGQDLRQLFMSDFRDMDNVPDALKPLAMYCHSADIVLFMINLKDFVGEGDHKVRMNNQIALKAAIEHLKKNGRQCCILFTQSDQYRDMVDARGGWMEIARQEINYVYGAYMADGSIPVFPVSAVNKTKVTINNGKIRRVPERGFESEGLADVLKWMTEQASKRNLSKIDSKPVKAVKPTSLPSFAPLLSFVLMLLAVGALAGLCWWGISAYLAMSPGNKPETKTTTDAESKNRIPYANELTLDLGNGVKMEMVLIKPATFKMGSPENEYGRDAEKETQHSVTISKAYYMARTAVTQRQFDAVMGANKNSSNFRGPENPVEKVTWFEAMEFCETLNEIARAQLPPGTKATLPTEAQWEHACRAGKETRFYFGDKDSDLGKYAWYEGNSSYKTHPVHELRPNDFGLFDMQGDVYQWCRDLFRDDYEKLTAVDPFNDPSNDRTSARVLRGGSWYGTARMCRSASRIGNTPDVHSDGIGFRVALSH